VTPGEPVEEKGAASDGRRRVPLMAIPITLSVGLLVGVGYVGNRIFAARFQGTPTVHRVTPAAPVASQTAPAPSEPPSQPSAAPQQPPEAIAPQREEKPAAIAKAASSPAVRSVAVPAPAASAPAIPHIQTNAAKPAGQEASVESTPELLVPQPGERYLQIIAVNSRFAPRVLADLQRSNADVHVAPGPREGLVRLLVGPYPDRESLERAKVQIQAQHPDCFVRIY
jgi:hypothetical protein